MKIKYDLSTMKSRKNPYSSKLKKSVAMRLSEDVLPKTPITSPTTPAQSPAAL